MIWTPEQLQRSPAEDLAIACNVLHSDDARQDAWNRYEIKKWYECICLRERVLIDVQHIPPEIGIEVAELRRLYKFGPPWGTSEHTVILGCRGSA